MSRPNEPNVQGIVGITLFNQIQVGIYMHRCKKKTLIPRIKTLRTRFYKKNKKS